MPFRQSAGSQDRALGCGAHSGEDEGVQVAQTELVGQFEFLEFTPDNHLRHSRFIGLREDKKAREVGPE